MGLGALGLIYFAERAHMKAGYRASPFKLIHSYAFIFLALAICLAFLKLDLMNFILLPASMSLYFLAAYYNRSHIPALKFKQKILQAFLGLSNFFCILLLSALISEGAEGELSRAFSLIFLSGMYVGFAFYSWRSKTQHLAKIGRYTNGVRIRFLFVQFFMLMCYAAFWREMSGQILGMGLSISMFIHGILLLFFSSQANRPWIQKIAFSILGIAFAKLILFDFQHFALLYKVGVSILSGALMLGGARMYLRKEMA
ncbi:MAG: hypothetical protein AAF696_10410, partial [Bacteroidota bacterium]